MEPQHTYAPDRGLENAIVGGELPATSKCPKHQSLHQAIMEMAAVTQHLNNLFCQITGEPFDPEKETDKTTPSLVELLNLAPDHVRHECKSAHEAINRIAEVLF